MSVRIIPRKEHNISRKQMSPNALRTLYRLHTRGFIAYLVGGCVRDLLLGKTPKDFDIATNATPGQIKRLFRNCRIIGRRFKLAHLHFENEILEVSTFRREALPSDSIETEEEGSHRRPPRHMKNEDGMVLRDNVFGTPEEDALRRDFTINALAYNIADFSVIDHSTGIMDLSQGIIRPIGDPQVRFTEDPLRMLRAVRFAASHSFAIEPEAWKCLCNLSSSVTRVPPSRLYEEVQKLLLIGSARSVFNLLEGSELLAALFPDLSQRITEDASLPARLRTKLDLLDDAYQRGTTPSVALFLVTLFGNDLEEAALERHRDGIPHQQAMDAACAAFTEDIRKTLCIPGRVAGRLHDILVLQHALRRMPPRRPAVTACRPELDEALVYLHISAQEKKVLFSALQWWESFLSREPEKVSPGLSTDEKLLKKKRKRRRKRRQIN